MITLYGIKNCDTMQKALKWLDAKGIPYKFHNYREDGLDEATVQYWLKHLPIDKVINTRSTTFRELPEAKKPGIKDKGAAIQLMLNNTSIIKRPLWDFGNDDLLTGWDEAEISKHL